MFQLQTASVSFTWTCLVPGKKGILAEWRNLEQIWRRQGSIPSQQFGTPPPACCREMGLLATFEGIKYRLYYHKQPGFWGYISFHKFKRMTYNLIQRVLLLFKGVLLVAKNMLRISSVSNNEHIRTKTCISNQNYASAHKKCIYDKFHHKIIKNVYEIWRYISNRKIASWSCFLLTKLIMINICLTTLLLVLLFQIILYICLNK